MLHSAPDNVSETKSETGTEKQRIPVVAILR